MNPWWREDLTMPEPPNRDLDEKEPYYLGAILARKAGVETMVKLKILYNLDEDTHIFESLTLCHKGLTIIARESQFQLIGPDINWTINRTEIKQLEAWIEE